MSLNSKVKSASRLISVVLIGIFFASLGFLFVKNNQYQKIAQENQKMESATVTFANTLAPTTITSSNSYFAKDGTDIGNKKPRVSAQAYLVGDLDTGQTILEKNQDEKFPIASVSKLMTALIMEETDSKDDTVTISTQALATEGKNGNLHVNQKLTVGNILYPLLLESSNDAAEAIALHSGLDTFLGEMNAKAKQIGMVSTSYEDPSGLSPNNQSTTNDLFKLAQYIKQNNPDLFKITTNKSFKQDKNNIWFSTSQFLKVPGYLGSKSGYTDQADQTIVSLFSVPLSPALPSRNIVITLLKSNDRKGDVANILSFLKNNISYGQKPQAVVVVPPPPVVPPVPDYVSLGFAGDIMLDRGVRNSVVKNFGGDYSKLFDNLDILKKFDIFFANLEGTASDQGADRHNLYSFRMDPAVVPALAGAGVDILSVASNHVGDWGRPAYIDTLARLTENETAYAGGGATESSAEQPTVIEKNGMRIGYLAFTDKGPDWMAATATEPGVLLASNPNFDQIVQNAMKQVDYLVVSFHFGEEYQTTHNARQTQLAHEAIDDGAKIVIGAHPHVVEETEVYKDGFIAYSLGNFIFDQPFSANTMQGMILELNLNKDGSMTDTKDMVQLNSAFQPASVTLGKEEKVNFALPKSPTVIKTQ
jgi:poly-gamma-glutamate synthesis protein (capsule biosynthesis protein)